MIVKIATLKGDLLIDLFLRESPIACRYLRQQINLKAWEESSFTHISETHAVLTCKKRLNMKIPKNSRNLKYEAGFIAYAENSALDLVIFRSSAPPSIPISAVIGRLTKKSFENLERQFSSKRRKLEPFESSSFHADINLPAEMKSDQLKSVIEFQQRLKKDQQNKANSRLEIKNLIDPAFSA